MYRNHLKFISIILISVSSYSEDLLDIYNEALLNDPQYRAAEYSYLADKEILNQSRAALLPSLSISGSTNWNEYYQDDQLNQEYNSFSYSANVTQPLLRLDYWFNYKRSKKLKNAAEATFAYEQQRLILRTAELYFGVLRSIDNLNASISEEKAILKQLDQTKQRYEVGLSAITEVQEAKLAYDLSQANRINNEGRLFNSRESLNALIGKEIISLEELTDKLEITLPEPSSKEEWVQKGLENNFQLKAALMNKDASLNNARKSASNHLPKINIVGSVSESETNQFNYAGISINGQGIPIPDVTSRRNYALQFSLPIFQSGLTNSQRRQAYNQYNQSSENALFRKRAVIQEVRSQYSNVVTLVANVNAQKQAVISASSALEATRVGYNVGTRNIVDLLQAEKNLYSAEKNLANAKYDFILAKMRLSLAAGTLSPESLTEINYLLD
jgi:outer membrane protein